MGHFHMVHSKASVNFQTVNKNFQYSRFGLFRFEYYRRKFKNLTCCRRSANQEMWSRRCDTAEMCEMRRIWRVGIAGNVVFFQNFVASPARKCQLLKTGVAEDRLPRMSPKFAPSCGARAIWKPKPLKHQGLGPLSLGKPMDFDTAFILKNARTYCNSEVKRPVIMSFFKEVPQKSFS